MVDVPRDVIDVLPQLLAFLGRQLALWGWAVGVLTTAVFHRGGTTAAFFTAMTPRWTLSTLFFLPPGLHYMPATEKATESAKATAFATRVRRRAGRAEGKYTGEQREALPKHH